MSFPSIKSSRLMISLPLLLDGYKRAKCPIVGGIQKHNTRIMESRRAYSSGTLRFLQ